MSFVNGVNSFLESKATAGTVFAVTGMAKLASDYKNAHEDKKKYVLAHDSIVLASSALGVLGYNVLSKKTLNSKLAKKAISGLKTAVKSGINSTPFNKAAKSFLKNSAEIANRCIDNTFMLGTGILAAIGADYAVNAVRLDKKLASKKMNTVETESFDKIYQAQNTIMNSFKQSTLNKTLDDTVGAELKSNMYNRVFDFPAMRMFATSMVGMQGFEVIQEKTMKERMKHTTKCLIANSVVPMFFLSTASTLTKNMKGILRLPITFATMIFGTMYANKFLEKHQYSHISSNKTT